MAESKKTVVELEAELASIKEENELLKSAGNHDLSWYQKQNDDLQKKLDLANSAAYAAKEKEHLQKIEAEVLKADEVKTKERELAQYNQSEHTRFRLLERPNRLNIFGTPDGPVFDLGIDLQYFTGPIQIEAYVIVEMARSIGMLTVEQAEALNKELAESKAKNEKAATLGSELTSGISALVDKFYADLGSVAIAGDVSVETESKADSGSVEPDHKLDETDGQANVDNSGEKPDGVSDATGNADGKSGSEPSPTIDDILGKL
jgi:hypothetical protein